MSETQFTTISDWMANGNINGFVKAHPDVNRLELVSFPFKVLLPLLHTKLSTTRIVGNVKTGSAFDANVCLSPTPSSTSFIHFQQPVSPLPPSLVVSPENPTAGRRRICRLESLGITCIDRPVSDSVFTLELSGHVSRDS